MYRTAPTAMPRDSETLQHPLALSLRTELDTLASPAVTLTISSFRSYGEGNYPLMKHGRPQERPQTHLIDLKSHATEYVTPCRYVIRSSYLDSLGTPGSPLKTKFYMK